MITDLLNREIKVDDMVVFVHPKFMMLMVGKVEGFDVEESIPVVKISHSYRVKVADAVNDFSMKVLVVPPNVTVINEDDALLYHLRKNHDGQ